MFGLDWQGLMISALSLSGLSAGFLGIQICYGGFSQDVVRHGQAC
jgi:hypothetical protein